MYSPGSEAFFSFDLELKACNSNVRAMGDQPLRARSWCRQLDVQRNLAFVAKDAELDGLILVLGFSLGGKFLPQIPNRAHALAIHRSDHVSGLHAGFFRS